MRAFQEAVRMGLEALWWLSIPVPIPHGMVPSWGRPPWFEQQWCWLKWEFVQSPRGSLKLISLRVLFFALPQEVIGS